MHVSLGEKVCVGCLTCLELTTPSTAAHVSTITTSEGENDDAPDMGMRRVDNMLH